MNKAIAINGMVSQVEGNIVSDMDGEKVMLSVQNGKYYNLGAIGGEIWEHLNEPISVDNLIDSLVADYEVTESECRQQVLTFLDHLAKEGLINVVPA